MPEKPVPRTVSAHARGERLHVPRHARTYAVLTGLRRVVETVIARDLPAGTSLTVVDYGCGSMPYRPLFEARAGRYLGADLPGNEIADILITPAGRVDLPDGSCDVVLSTQVLEHVLSPQAYLEECNRLLRSGGRAIVSTHGYWWYHPDPTDLWRWTGDGLRRQLELADFAVVRAYGVIGLAGAGLQLFQDAVHPRLWWPLRSLFALVMQCLVQLLDKLHGEQDRCREALVLVVVAEKREPS